MNKKIINFLIISLSLILLNGCGYTDEQKENMSSLEKTAEKNAIEYIEDKYGFVPKVVEVSCDTKTGGAVPSLWPDATGDVFVEMKYKGKDFFVFINGETENTKGYDNYQADSIRERFIKEMENQLNCKIICAEMTYGLNSCTDINDRRYGLVNDYYDGNNLKEIFENSDSNSASIEYIQKGDSNISKNNIISTFGENCTYLFVNYKDANSYKLKGDYRFNVGGSPIEYGIDDNCIFINDYTIIRAQEKEYTKYEMKKLGDILYIAEGGTYCKFIKTTMESASKWNRRGFTNAKQIYDAYEIDTDAKSVKVWIPADDIKNKAVNGFRFVSQYYNNGAIQYNSHVTGGMVGNDEYLYGKFYIKNYEQLKFSVFTDLD